MLKDIEIKELSYPLPKGKGIESLKFIDKKS